MGDGAAGLHPVEGAELDVVDVVPDLARHGGHPGGRLEDGVAGEARARPARDVPAVPGARRGEPRPRGVRDRGPLHSLRGCPGSTGWSSFHGERRRSFQARHAPLASRPGASSLSVRSGPPTSARPSASCSAGRGARRGRVRELPWPWSDPTTLPARARFRSSTTAPPARISWAVPSAGGTSRSPRTRTASASSSRAPERRPPKPGPRRLPS